MKWNDFEHSAAVFQTLSKKNWRLFYGAKRLHSYGVFLQSEKGKLRIENSG
jgi:hypothetical protein